MERKLKILITDDSSLLRKKLRMELESLDCEVVEAKNGKEAVMECLKEQPDGIILDIVMPEINGVEALRAIREICPDMHVVMLSSTSSAYNLIETLKLGAMDFIQKPYTSEQIRMVVNRLRKKVQQDA